MTSTMIQTLPCHKEKVLPVKIQTLVMKKSSKTCAICIQGFEEQQIIKKLYCNHIFHRKCLKEWLKKTKVCPLCRADLSD